MAGLTLPGIGGKWYYYDERVVLVDDGSGSRDFLAAPTAFVPVDETGAALTARNPRAPYDPIPLFTVDPSVTPEMLLPAPHYGLQIGGSIVWEADYTGAGRDLVALEADYLVTKAQVAELVASGGANGLSVPAITYPVTHTDAGVWQYPTLQSALDAGYREADQAVFMSRGDTPPAPPEWMRPGIDDNVRAG